MADLQISIGARDEASQAFQKVGDSGKKMGEDVKKGALTAEEALLEQYQAMEKLEKKGAELLRLQSKYSQGGATSLADAMSRLKTEAAAAEKAAQAAAAAANVPKRLSAEEIGKNMSSLERSLGIIGDKTKGVGVAAEEAGTVSKAGMAAIGLAAAGAAIAVGKLYEFGKQGVADFIEAEKADQQLAAAVKQLGYNADQVAPALSDLGEELESQTLVSGETIKNVEQLLLRYGVAPKNIEKTTRATLDFAAATGKDANTAAQLMIRAMSGGGEEMKAFGIAVKRTGDSTKDLNSLVDEMTAKFGGSAVAATEGLGGAIGRLDKAESDLGKSFGSFIAQVEAKLGVVKTLTTFMNELNDAVFGNGQQDARQAALDQNKALKERGDLVRKQLEDAKRLRDELEKSGGTARDANGGVLDLAAARKRVAALTLERNELDNQRHELQQKWKGIADVGQSGAAAAAQAAADAINEGSEKQKKALEDQFTILDGFRDEHHKHALAAMKKLGDQEHALLQIQFEGNRRINEIDEEEIRRHFDALKHSIEKQDSDWQRLMGQHRNRIGQLAASYSGQMADATAKAGQQVMYDAGIQVGNAFISGLDQALTQTENGGEFDVGAMIATILPIAIAAGLTVAGVPLPLAMLVGQAGGVLVKHGISAATHGQGLKVGGDSSQTYHSGGIVDDRPRFHNGLAADEVDAVLQKGEAVWSRGDVARAGGPRAVEDMRRGGGGMNVVVQTMDSQSFSEWIGDRGGAGFVRTLDNNRGEVAQRFRRLARRNT